MKIANEEKPVPADAIEALARCLYPAVLEYFESEQGKREFAEWRATRDGTEALSVPTGKEKLSEAS